MRGVGLDPSRPRRTGQVDLGRVRWPACSTPRRPTSGRADFAVRLAERRRLSTLGPLSVVLREEPDLRSVLRLLMRYEHSYNEALRMRLDESEEIATLRLWFEFGEPAPAGQALALGAAAVYGIIRECARTEAGDPWPSASSTARPQTSQTYPPESSAQACSSSTTSRAWCSTPATCTANNAVGPAHAALCPAVPRLGHLAASR